MEGVEQSGFHRPCSKCCAWLPVPAPSFITRPCITPTDSVTVAVTGPVGQPVCDGQPGDGAHTSTSFNRVQTTCCGIVKAGGTFKACCGAALGTAALEGGAAVRGHCYQQTDFGKLSGCVCSRQPQTVSKGKPDTEHSMTNKRFRWKGPIRGQWTFQISRWWHGKLLLAG